MNKKIIISVLIGLVVLAVGTIFIYESQQPTPSECSSEQWNATYIYMDEGAGPCTYLQRVTSSLSHALLFPVLFMWPILLCLFAYIMFSLVKYRSFKSVDPTLFIYLSLPTVLWVCWSIALALLGR